MDFYTLFYSLHTKCYYSEVRCKSMFTNAVLSPQPAQAEAAGNAGKGGNGESMMQPLQKTPAPLIGPGKEGQARKPLFGKSGRRESGTARLVEEISRMNGLLELIAKNQAAMQKTLEGLEKKVNLCMRVLDLSAQEENSG
ncbi:uncharacterized protein [Blastocystis hominis]|uniref:Uncharacterized protein n=1 Tax=Blastocystis hominis TaxID=12968 RepID=D8M884_BLAHO|nr:uncharacterized protein [Blastocystis hominis]CBK24273.2 unnamed protein product [Blastocystis hominis]|eukprot:XP_012898321.1 uncharacterized protein [Blastocystis hominis]